MCMSEWKGFADRRKFAMVRLYVRVQEHIGFPESKIRVVRVGMRVPWRQEIAGGVKGCVGMSQ